jgi:hypothetical protein
MMKLNVGLSRKVGEPNYGSRGASVNLELELDSALVGDSARLKERIRQLFGVVRASLAEELNAAHGHSQQPSGNTKPAASQNGNGNGHSANPQQARDSRQATQAQVKAIERIARNRQVDLAVFLKDRFQLASPADLSLREASQAIDELRNPDSQES